jgi:hypothetical protein
MTDTGTDDIYGGKKEGKKKKEILMEKAFARGMELNHRFIVLGYSVNANDSLPGL